eukprot:scaffold97392_cov54-Phaeocystis_antarctica.AAC.1
MCVPASHLVPAGERRAEHLAGVVKDTHGVDLTIVKGVAFLPLNPAGRVRVLEPREVVLAADDGGLRRVVVAATGVVDAAAEFAALAKGELGRAARHVAQPS